MLDLPAAHGALISSRSHVAPAFNSGYWWRTRVTATRHAARSLVPRECEEFVEQGNDAGGEFAVLGEARRPA